MNLYAKLLERKDKPLRIGVIGAGKFGAMYIAQVPRTPGVHLVGIADLSPDSARRNLERVGWPKEAYEASSLDAAIRERRTYLSEDWPALVAHPEIDIIIESTRNPAGGGGARPGGLPQRKACRHGHGGSRRLLRSAPCAQGSRGGRGLQPRLRRPARAHLRPR